MRLFLKKVTVKSGLLFLVIFMTLFIVGSFLFIDFTTDGMLRQPIYTAKDMINHYEKNEEAILKVVNFVTSKVGEKDEFKIEFKNGKIDLLYFQFDGMYLGFQYNDLEIYSNKTVDILEDIDWTIDDLVILKEKLDNAGCVSVSNGNSVSIGWMRKGLGVYWYHIYDKNLDNDLIDKYNSDCSYSFYKDNILLEYQELRANSPCFPE